MINSYNNIDDSNFKTITDNILSFFIIDNETYEIKAYNIIRQIKITENIVILKNIFEKIIKINNNLNQSYYYKIIYFSEIIIIALVNFDYNNIFLSIFNNNNNKNQNQNSFNKLFLLHIAISYRNTFSKLSKFIPNERNLFSLVYSKIFFIPFLHNFDKVFSLISKKIDLVLFGNSEYISSMVLDLDNKEVIYDTGYLVQKKYKASFLDFSKKNKIIDEIIFFGQKLKNNYFKSGDKNIYKIENCIKLEFRATFPKPLFILRFFPILKGVLLVHIFHQYKLSKIQILNPLGNGEHVFEKYKEIDAVFFDFFSKLEEINNKSIINIEKFFFEYFFILGNNIKELGKNSGYINKNLMTYKNKEFDVVYLNKQILLIIKDSIGKYYLNNKENKNENVNDLIYKLKKRLGDEYDKYKNEDINKINNINNTNTLGEDFQIRNEKINTNNIYTDNLNINDYENFYNNNINKSLNILEFNFINFLQEFDLNKLYPNDIKIKSDKVDDNNINNNEVNIINPNEINVQFPSEYSNVDEYSKLNLTKDNIELIQRNIITSATRTNLISKTTSRTNVKSNLNNLNNNEQNINIYGNYEIMNTETKNLKTEEINEEIRNNNEDPFKIDITSIPNNIITSKEESDFKSILTEKEKII